MKAWEGLGYYSRARNLHRAAQAVVTEHHGMVPADLADLKSLPGIGPYTAGAILSIAFKKPFPVLDGNIMRVLSRYFHVTESVDLSETKTNLWTISKS